MDILKLSATDLGKEIRDKNISVKEVLDAYFQRIKDQDKKLNAFITVDIEGAYKKGEEIAGRINSGELTHPLAGVPIGIKDNISTRNIKTTCGSKMLSNYVPVFNATAVDAIEGAGAIVIGKTNMDEFAMGSTTETSYYGPAKNPVNTAYAPGGSSGGSCVAVKSGECTIALGSDTGGSIRQPASHCGVVGIKPGYGSVSRYGLTAYASSFDQIGPIGRNVRDCVTLLDTITGYDNKDSTSRKRTHQDYTMYLAEDIKGMRIGIPRNYLVEGIDPEVKQILIDSAKLFEEAGAVVSEFELGLTKYALSSYYIIACAQASSNLSRFDGVKYGFRSPIYTDLDDMLKRSREEGFGKEVKKRIALGTFALSAGYYDDYYVKANKTRALIKREYEKAFERFDLILTPVSPSAAPLLGRSLEDPLKMYLGDIYTIGANLTGIPGISLPAGKSRSGLPIGIQLLAGMNEEDKMIRAAYTFEKRREDI